LSRTRQAERRRSQSHLSRHGLHQSDERENS
jgi:hypothetical protein